MPHVRFDTEGGVSYRELLLFCARHAGKWSDAQPALAEKLREALRTQVGAGPSGSTNWQRPYFTLAVRNKPSSPCFSLHYTTNLNEEGQTVEVEFGRGLGAWRWGMGLG